MNEQLGVHAKKPHQLPPISLRAEEFKNPDSRSFTKLETPLSPIGLVDKPKLIKLVRGTLNSAYNWPSTLDDEHHLQWPRRNYQYLPDEAVNPYEFRNLALNKGYWPRNFHNWVHKVTEPPPVPHEDAMYYTTQAQLSIDSLHRSVQIAKMLTRNRSIQSHNLNSRLDELFESYSEALNNFSSLPPEFHFIDIEEHMLGSVDELLTVGGKLGKLATVDTVAMTTRHIKQTTFKTAITAA